MPRVASDSRSGILEGLELESLGCQPDSLTVREQPFPICRNQVGHCMAFPAMAVKPETAIHGEDHSFPSAAKFAIRERCVGGHASTLGNVGGNESTYWQAINPSLVAGANAGTEPKNTEHWIGQASGCVTFADQPPAVAAPKDTVTPEVMRILSALTSVVYDELS